MKTIVVINAKGGVGKTTVATNLASYFVTKGMATAIMDYDPQGSSLNWVKQRSPMMRRLYVANAASNAPGLRAFATYLPPEIERLVVDAPAGTSRLLQQDLMRNASHVLIPVSPSAIDIHATANFIKELLLQSRVRMHGVQVGVVANRVPGTRPVYAPLERFLRSLGMPLLTRLADSEIYVDAAETGVGIFEMHKSASGKECNDFMPICEWIEGASNVSHDSENVIPMPAACVSAAIP